MLNETQNLWGKYLKCAFGCRLPLSIILFTALIIAGPISIQAQSTIKTRITGATNWSDPGTWIQLRTGTTAFTLNSTLVTGTGTLFTTELQVGDIIMLDASPATVRGTVASITSNTSLTLTTNAAATVATSAYGRQFVPASADNVQIGNTALASTITLNLDINTTIGSLTFIADNLANVLNHANTNTLTVSNNVTINQPTVSTTVAWNINNGSAIVGGNVSLTGASITTTRFCKINIHSGTLAITGDLAYNMASGAIASMAEVDMSGGSGTLSLKGNITFGSGGVGTLTPGTSSLFVYNGTGSQTIQTQSAVSYNDLKIEKPSGTASLMATTTINGNLVLQQGTMSASASNYGLTVNGNWTNNGGTYSGGTSTVTLAGASGTINGTTAFPNLRIDAATPTAYTLNNNNSCSSLAFIAGSSSSSLTHAASANLTVNGAVTLNQPTATATSAWNINGGSATVSGLVSFAGTSTTTGRNARMVITTGTLNANGGMSLTASANSTKVIDMSGGAGVINLKGTLTVPSLSGTLTAGTAGSIFNYADDVSAQTINFFAAGAYNNLHAANLHSSGAALNAAVTTSNVTGNIRVTNGTFSNGGNAIAFNSNKIFEVANGATFKMTGTSGMVTGTNLTKTWGSASTIEYGGTTQTISTENYINLLISGSGTKTVTAALSVSGALTISTPSVLNMSTFVLLDGFTSNSGTGTLRTQNTSNSPFPSSKTWQVTVEYSNSAGGQTIVDGIYSSLTNSNTSGANSVTTDLTVNGTLTLNTSSILNMGSYDLKGSLTSVTGAGIIRTQSISSAPVAAGKTWSGTIEFNNTSGGQKIVSGTYTNIISGTGSSINAVTGTVSVSGTLTIPSGCTLDLETNVFSSLSTISGTGTLRTLNTSATPLPSGKTWTGTVEFNNASGGQTIVAGTYSNIVLGNTSGTQTVSGAISVSSSLNIPATTTVDFGTNALSGAFAITGTGTLRTLNTSSTPLPANHTWTCTVAYASSSAQTVVYGNYTNLNLTGGNRTISTLGTIDISGNYTPSAGTTTVTSSTIEFSGNDQVIPAGSYNTVVLSGGSKLYNTGTSAMASITLPAGITMQMNGGTISLSGSSTLSGTWDHRGGTILSSGTLTVGNGGTLSLIAGTIHLASSVGTNPIANLVIQTGGTINQAGGTLAVRDYITSPGTFNQTGSGALFIVFRDFKPGLYSIFYSTGGTVQFTGSGISPRFDQGSQQFNNIIINSGADPKFSYISNGVIPVAGNFTNNNTTLSNNTYSTFIFNGSSDQTIYSASSNSEFGHVILDNPDNTINFTSNIGVAGNWTNRNNTPTEFGNYNTRFTGSAPSINGTSSFGGITLASGTNTTTMNADNSCTFLTIEASGNSGGLTQAASTKLIVSGNVTFNTPNSSDVTRTWSINSGSAEVGGSVLLGTNNGSSDRIAKIVVSTGSLSIGGNLVYNCASGYAQTAVVDMSSGASSLYLKGSIVLTYGSGTLSTSSTSKVVYNGTGAQTVRTGSSVSYYNLYVEKPSGTATLGSSINVTNVYLNQGQLSGAASYALNVSGNWTNNGGTTINAPIVNFSGTSKSITGTGTTDFGALTFSSGGSRTLYNTITCTSLTMPSASSSITLTQTATSSLRVNGNVTINQPSSDSKTSNWNIASGTATVTGTINLGGTNTNTSRISKIALTTGSLHANGNIVYSSSSSAAATGVIDMSGGAGTLNLKGNITLTNGGGTITPGTTSSVNFNGSSAQTINLSSQLKYNNININNATTVTVGAAITSAKVTGHLKVITGILENGGFSIAGATSKTFVVENGSTFRLTGTSGMVTGFSRVFGNTSTVEYKGAAQSVAAETYGHLVLSGSSGSVVKTMPGTSFTVTGNFSSTSGTATSVSYTAASAINFNGSVTIGSNSTFNGSTFTHNLSGNWVNNGVFTAATSTLVFAGNNTTISGSATHNLNNLSISGVNVNTNASINLSGNLFATSGGTFNHNGGVLTMTGSGKTISGTDIKLNDIVFSGTITSAADVLITGNMTVSSGGNITTSDGSFTLSGAAKTITNSGTCNLFNLTVKGSLSTASSFAINSYMEVTTGTFTASAGTITFTGTSTFDGIANLFNVTVNGTALTLASDAVLGIANLLTKTSGVLDVTTSTPNTVIFNGVSNKNIESGNFHNLVFAGNTNTATGNLTVNGNLTINPSATFSGSSFSHTVLGNWTNNGIFTPATSTVLFSGNDDANIYGATTFNNLTINNLASENVIHLWADVTAATVNMNLGSLNTKTFTLNITGTRTGAGIIMGTIKRTHSFTNGVDYAFESPSNLINFSAVSGVTSVTVKVTSGSISDFPFGGSVNRLYELTVPAGTYTANLRLHYENTELNGNQESSMGLWNYNGSSWISNGKSLDDTTLNYVQKDGLNDISGKWTFSNDNNVVRWNGSISTDWFNPLNWTAVQGAPSRPPGANDIIQIGYISYNNAPAIAQAAHAKSISFGSVKASTINLSAGGSLTVYGNISGTWSANATHTINVNAQNLTVNGDVLLSDGTASRLINVNISTGSLSLTGSLTQTGNANIVFSGAGNLNIGQNYNYTSGTFTRSTGTVTYNGTGAQTVAPVNYQNLTVNKLTGIATLAAAATISGNLAVSKGELNINAASTITGNVTVSAGANLKSAIITLTVGGNWSNSGTFTPSSGTVTFNGTGAQSISATPFNTITINKTAGTATATGNLAIASNLTITAGTLDLGTFTANRNTGGGTFTLSSGANLIVGGANNFPASYTTNTIGSTSTSTFNGTVAQTVPVKTYGHLVFINGGANAKTAAGAITVNGNVTINNGATFGGSSYILTLAGNWTNSGTFIPGTSTAKFTGTSKTITGNTNFNILTLQGSTTISGTDISTSGLFTIASGGSLTAGSGTLTIGGDFTNNGTFNSTGTATFSGLQVQTIQFVNATATNFNTANFNGTVAPVLASTSSPTFNTVTINNTGGITTGVSWYVNNAFTISTGATFNGNNNTHYFYGSFTNNGSVSSSGTLNFMPATAQTIQLRGTSFVSTGTVSFGGAGAMTVSGLPNTLTNILIDNTTGVSPASNWTIAGDFSINENGIFNAGNYAYTVAGDIQSSGTLNGNTSAFTMTSADGGLSGSATTVFYDLTLTGNIAARDDYYVSRNFTVNGTYEGSGGVLTMTGPATATLGGTASPFNLANLSIQKNTGSSVTLAKNITAVSSLAISSGILDAANFSITQDVTSGGSLELQNTGILKIGGTNTLPVFSSLVIDDATTVEYYGSTQTITSVAALGITYGNLVVSSAGTKTANGALNIRGNLTIATATFVPGAFTDTLAGNLTMASGEFTNTGNTFRLNGIVNQTVQFSGSFNHLIINKGGGDVNLASDITVAGTLTFTAGKITTGNFTVISTSGTVAAAGQTTGWINGKFRRSFSSGVLTGTFPVGGVNNYNPFSLAFASITTAGTITGSSGGVHAQLATSGITPDKNIARTWTVTNTGGVVFTNYSATLNWNESQNYASFDSALLKASLYSGSTWLAPAISGIPTTTSLTTNTITAFGDFVIGEKCDVKANFSYSAPSFCTSGANAAATITPGSIAGAFSATPAGLSINTTTGLINMGASAAKSYTVSNAATGTGGCITSFSVSVTLAASASATISYAGTPFCTTTASGSVTRSGTAGGTYSSTAGLIINASTGAINSATSTPGTYTVTYTIAAANGCSQFQTTASVRINGEGYWKGAASTDWNTSSNWQCGVVPPAGSAIVIPGSLPYYPVIPLADRLTVSNLTVQSGGSFTINGSVAITGTISAAAGSINAVNGIIEMEGTSAQTIPAGIFSGTINTLYANNAAGVTLGGTLSINNLLRIMNGTLNTGDFLVLKSTALKTAMLGAITSPAATPINGKVTVERYIPGRRKYRLITSPVTTSNAAVLTAGQEALSIWGNWQNAGVAISGIGTQITGGTTADGFDQGSTTVSLFTYNETTKKFVNHSSANGKNTKYTPLKAGAGYYMFIYGDRVNSLSTTTPNPTTLAQKGTLLTGNQVYTTTSALPISGTVGNFTLIGNPYAAPVDWKSVTKSNVSNTLWGWDANLSNTGGYVTVTATGIGAIIAPQSNLIAVGRYIQPGQAFFVQTTGEEPQLTITESDKAEDQSYINNLVFRGAGAKEQPMMAINLLYNNGFTTSLNDGSVMAFDSSFSNSLTDDDGLKFVGSTEGLGLVVDNNLVSINARKYPAPNDTVPINLARLTKSQYTLQIFATDMANTPLTPWLEDSFLNTQVPLSLTDTNYIKFNVNLANAAEQNASRFKIIFKANHVLPISFGNVSATKKDKSVEIKWEVVNESNTGRYQVQHSVDGISFTDQSVVQAKGNNNMFVDYSILDDKPFSGKNYYRIKSVATDGSLSFSKVVMIAMDKNKGSIKVTPNPVTDQNLHIIFRDMDAGIYRFVMHNTNGQVISEQMLDHSGGQANFPIRLTKQLPRGFYNIQVVKEGLQYSEMVLLR